MLAVMLGGEDRRDGLRSRLGILKFDPLGLGLGLRFGPRSRSGSKDGRVHEAHGVLRRHTAMAPDLHPNPHQVVMAEFSSVRRAEGKLEDRDQVGFQQACASSLPQWPSPVGSGAGLCMYINSM